MATVNKVKWTQNGKAGEAFQVRYTDAAGKRRGKNFALKRDAEKYRLQVEVDIEAGAHVAPSQSQKVATVVAEYLAYCEARHVEKHDMSTSHLKRTRIACEKHIIPAFGARKLVDLSFKDVEMWTTQMTTEKRLARSTVSCFLQALRSMLDFGIKRGYAKKNIAAEVAATRVRRFKQDDPIRTLTREEVARLLAAAEVRPLRRSIEPFERLRLFVNIAVFCGLRYGEINGLTLGCLDIDARVISVQHNLTNFNVLKGPKTPAGVRLVPMPHHVAELLRGYVARNYRANDRSLVFSIRKTGATTAANFHGMWTRLLERAELKSCPRLGGVHFHALRHFNASMLIARGLPITDVARQLGHSHVDTTMRTYAHAMAPPTVRMEVVDGIATEILGPQMPSSPLAIAQN